MTGITILDLNYSARFLKSLGASLNLSYFIRNDFVTPNNFYIEESENKNLGGEIFARIVWSPVSDIQLNLGGGAFFPSLGNVWSDEKVRWRIDLTAVLALY
jgi:hypothetical protein